jgi:O-acetyl-ADP-ribose deacetylase (regulator of RNase III)
VRYEAIRAGLALVRDHALRLGATVHMPRIGCGLAGGRWEMIEPLVAEELERHGVEVTVYDLA